MKFKNIKIFLYVTMLIAIVGTYFFNIENKNSQINISYLASLTGKDSNIGRSAYYGALMAVEENNYIVNKKKINLFIENIDFNNSNNDNKILKKILNNDKNKIIISGNNSTVTKKIIDFYENKKNKLILGTASSSKELNSDNFIRFFYKDSEKIYVPLVKYFKENKIKKLLFYMQDSNPIYSDKILKDFIKINNKLNYNIEVECKKFHKKPIDKLEKIKLEKYDAIFMFAKAFEVGKIAQYIKIKNIDIYTISIDSTMNFNLLEYGGEAIENMLFPIANIVYDEKEYEKFEKKYYNRFKKKSNLFASYGYITMKKLINSLSECNGDNLECIKNNLLNNGKKYFGMRIKFNKNNLEFKAELKQYKKGKFVKIK